MSHFPIRRLRRLRRTPALRRLVQETQLAPAQLVWPLFVCHGEGVRREVPALPGVYQTSVDELVQDAERARRLGLGGIILFGLPETKDATGSEAYDEQGIVQQAARAVKRAVPDLLVVGDVCLCEYTDRKSTRLNSSHSQISYAVFCLKKKKKNNKKLFTTYDISRM